MHDFCGIDFGTSNSTLGVLKGNQASLVSLEGNKDEIPSALFFDSDTEEVTFGRAAIKNYIDGYDGRFMRALKSILGNSLINEKTRIGRKNYSFQDILALFIRHLKKQGERETGTELKRLVLGRPVFFVDHDGVADKQAETTLEAIARSSGFDDVTFQYEPIAAALDYEQTISGEKTALIVDIGGGTADFSVVKVSENKKNKVDRFDDILSTNGIHIGGTDFDRVLNLKAVMPHLGYSSEIKDNFSDNILEIPSVYYHDLSTWHKINFLYSNKIVEEVKLLHRKSLSPQLIQRLLKVLEDQQGHNLSLEVERTKIALSSQDKTAINLSKIENDLLPEIELQTFIETISTLVEDLKLTLKDTLLMAGVTPKDIGAVFFTGGSTAIPFVRQELLSLIPEADIIDGDMFGSVGKGLILEAQKRYL